MHCPFIDQSVYFSISSQASSLPSLVTENADPEVTAVVLKQLLGR